MSGNWNRIHMIWWLLNRTYWKMWKNSGKRRVFQRTFEIIMVFMSISFWKPYCIFLLICCCLVKHFFCLFISVNILCFTLCIAILNIILLFLIIKKHPTLTVFNSISAVTNLYLFLQFFKQGRCHFTFRINIFFDFSCNLEMFAIFGREFLPPE